MRKTIIFVLILLFVCFISCKGKEETIINNKTNSPLPIQNKYLLTISKGLDYVINDDINGSYYNSGDEVIIKVRENNEFCIWMYVNDEYYDSTINHILETNNEINYYEFKIIIEEDVILEFFKSKITDIIINNGEPITGFVGESKEVTLDTSDYQYKTISYEIEDESVATISNSGIITFVNVGSTTLKVVIDGEIKIISVSTLEKEIETTNTELKSVMIQPVCNDFGSDDTFVLEFSCNPSDYEYDVVSWSVSDESVASIENGILRFIKHEPVTVYLSVDGVSTITNVYPIDSLVNYQNISEHIEEIEYIEIKYKKNSNEVLDEEKELREYLEKNTYYFMSTDITTLIVIKKVKRDEVISQIFALDELSYIDYIDYDPLGRQCHVIHYSHISSIQIVHTFLYEKAYVPDFLKEGIYTCTDDIINGIDSSLSITNSEVESLLENYNDEYFEKYILIVGKRQKLPSLSIGKALKINYIDDVIYFDYKLVIGNPEILAKMEYDFRDAVSIKRSQIISIPDLSVKTTIEYDNLVLALISLCKVWPSPKVD